MYVLSTKMSTIFTRVGREGDKHHCWLQEGFRDNNLAYKYSQKAKMVPCAASASQAG